MQIGLLTSALGQAGFFSAAPGTFQSSMSFMDKAAFAADAGFETLEVSAGIPELPGPPSDFDLSLATPDSMSALTSQLARMGIPIGCLSFYDNNLHPDAAMRGLINRATEQTIEAAAFMGVPVVSTFIGMDYTLSLTENFDAFERVFTGLVQKAEDNHVKLTIENCTLLGMNPNGGPATISSTPVLWEEMFRRIPSDSFGLTYDPEHSVSMFMDPLACIKGFENRIFHMHAKDAVILQEDLNRNGIFEQLLVHPSFPGASYIKACLPGRGVVDWKALLVHMENSGYTGVICVEHEDREFMATDARIEEGFLLGLQTLRQAR